MSYTNRLRFRAVYRQWHLAAQEQHPLLKFKVVCCPRWRAAAALLVTQHAVVVARRDGQLVEHCNGDVRQRGGGWRWRPSPCFWNEPPGRAAATTGSVGITISDPLLDRFELNS
jgi:hypothetical protein